MKTAKVPALEWIASAAGLILLAAVLAMLAREAMSGATRDVPEIKVKAVRIVPAASGFVLEFSAANRSRATAAAVTVEGELPSGETASAVIDYVPGRSTRRGGLFFTENPRGAELRALGYQDP